MYLLRLVALASGLAVITQRPTLFSPFPLATILAVKKLDIPVPLVSIAAGATFALSHFRHFIGKPKETQGAAFVLALVGMTLLSVAYFCVDFPLGIVERGRTHTVAILLNNLAFAGAAWFVWFRARRPGRYCYQVIFGFLLYTWFFWCSLPYLGSV